VRKPELSSTYWILFTICLVTAFFQFDVTIAILRDWWQVKHPPQGFFVVSKWWTHYTVMSALYAPTWIVCIGSTILLARRWPRFVVFLLAGFLILEPVSCMAMPGVRGGYGHLLGLEELPIAGAERDSNADVLGRIDQKLNQWGGDHGHFPFNPTELEDAVPAEMPKNSPYTLNGTAIPYRIVLVQNSGTLSRQIFGQPGVVNYAVNADGTQFVLTISGLNMPVSEKISMMRESTFVGGKQPWDGLLAVEENKVSKVSR
jgi:hypothetical protein